MRVTEYVLALSLQVTVVAPYNPSDKVRTVLLEDGDTSVFVKDAFQEHRLEGIFTVAFASSGLCSDQLAKPEVQELLKQKFDVAILSVVFCDCFLSIVHQLKVANFWNSLPSIVTLPSYVDNVQDKSLKTLLIIVRILFLDICFL